MLASFVLGHAAHRAVEDPHPTPTEPRSVARLDWSSRRCIDASTAAAVASKRQRRTSGPGLRIVRPVHETTLHRHGGWRTATPTRVRIVIGCAVGGVRSPCTITRTRIAHAGHGHSHGLVDDSIKRSGEGVRAVVISLAVLAVTAALQGVVFIASGSVALLADLIHNAGDALTAIPLGIAFAMRSRRAEGYAGLAVVAAIFISALVAGAESIRRLIDPARRATSGSSPPPERSATWATGSPRRSARAPVNASSRPP